MISPAAGCESVLTAQGKRINIDLTEESCYLFILLLDNPPVAVASGSITDKDKHPPSLGSGTSDECYKLVTKGLVWGWGRYLLNSFSAPPIPFLSPFFLPLDGLIFPGRCRKASFPWRLILPSSNGLRRAVLFQGGQKGLNPISMKESLGRDCMILSKLE